MGTRFEGTWACAPRLPMLTDFLALIVWFVGLERQQHFYKRIVDRLGFQGQKQLPPFSDPSKSEGRRGLYSLSVDGRSERKEGILEDSMG